MPGPLPFIAAAAGRALMKKLLKSGLGRKDSAGLVEQAMGSKAVRDALTKKPKYSLPNVAVPSQITMSKGGAVKKMESGGEVRASRKSARKSIDGCAVRGKTRAVKNV